MSGNSIVPNNHAANNSQVKHNQIIAWVTGILTLLLALFAFVLSFNALTDLAHTHKVSIPPLFPFVVEFGVIIFSLNALFRSMNGESAKWQWSLVIGSSLLAGLLNIAHAETDILSRTMAAMPSLFLLLSFESFLSLLKYSVTRQSAIVTLDKIQSAIADKNAAYDKLLTDKQAQLDKLNGQIEKSQAQLDTLRSDIRATKQATKQSNVQKMTQAKQDKVAQRRQQVLSMLEAGKSEDDMATALNVSVRTIQRDIESLNGQVRVS